MSDYKDSVSQEECLRALLNDETISDLILVCSNGERVLAHRGFLAAKSPVFRTMLFGNFAEGSQKEVTVDFAGNVMRVVLEYIYLDKVDLFHNEQMATSTEFKTMIVKLVDAADFFQLGTLCQLAIESLRKLFKKNPSLSVECFCFCESPIVEGELLTTIRSNPELLLESEFLHDLSPSKMKTILKDSLEASEFVLFKIIHAWSKEKESALCDGSAQQDSMSSRKRDAATLTCFLSLECIHPEDLRKTVAPSSLVTEKQINAAYEAQALVAAKYSLIPSKRARLLSESKWASSKNAELCSTASDWTVETLGCRPLRAGVRKWGIKVETLVDGMELGVASSEHPVKKNWQLCHQDGGWAFKNVSRIVPFEEGSMIWLTLDLTHKHSGMLSASVDGRATQELHCNMFSTFRTFDKIGFLPAVCLKAPGKVRFLGFE